MAGQGGRPKIGQTRKVVIPPEQYADLKVIASLRGVPMATVMRDAYAHYIDHVLRKRRTVA